VPWIRHQTSGRVHAVAPDGHHPVRRLPYRRRERFASEWIERQRQRDVVGFFDLKRHASTRVGRAIDVGPDAARQPYERVALDVTGSFVDGHPPQVCAALELR